MSHPSHAAWFRHSNNIPWKIQFMKLLHTHIHYIDTYYIFSPLPSSSGEDLNPTPSGYKSVALPLKSLGEDAFLFETWTSFFILHEKIFQIYRVKLWSQHLPDTNQKRYHLNHSVKMPSCLEPELIFLYFVKKRFQIYRVTSVGTEFICPLICTSEGKPHKEAGKEEFVPWIWRSNQTNQLNALKTLFSLHE